MIKNRIIDKKIILIYIVFFMIFLILQTSIVHARNNDKFNEEYTNIVVDEINNDHISVISKLEYELHQKKYETNRDVSIINCLLAYAYEKDGQFDKCESYIVEAVRLFTNNNDFDSVIKLYMYLINVYNRNGDFKNSLIYSKNILGLLGEEVEISDKIKRESKVLTLSTLIKSCTYFGLYDEVDGYIKDLDSYLDLNSKYETELSLEVRFFYYLDKENFDKAEEILNDSIVFNKVNNKDLYLSTIDIVNERFDEAYNKLKRLKQYFKDSNDEYNLGKLYNIEGDYYKVINEYDKALQSYEAAYDIFSNLKMDYWSARIVDSIISTKVKNKDEKSLLKYIEIINNYNEKHNKDEESLIRDLLSTKEKLLSYEIKEINEENEVIKIRNIYISKIFNIVIIIAIVLSVIVVILVKNINKRKKSELKLKELMSKDYLTKAYTREYTYEYIYKLINQNIKFTMALLDLDDFKRINDSYGHIVGDEVLKKISLVVVKHLDERDIFGRFGGEEFIIVFTEKNNEQCFDICEEIREEIRNIYWPHNNLITTVSIGMREYNNTDLEVFTHSVDELLYKAKHSGKNKTCI